MTSHHERNETLSFAAITLSFAAAMFALSFTSDQGSFSGRPESSSATADAE